MCEIIAAFKDLTVWNIAKIWNLLNALGIQAAERDVIQTGDEVSQISL